MPSVRSYSARILLRLPRVFLLHTITIVDPCKRCRFCADRNSGLQGCRCRTHPRTLLHNAKSQSNGQRLPLLLHFPLPITIRAPAFLVLRLKLQKPRFHQSLVEPRRTLLQIAAPRSIKPKDPAIIQRKPHVLTWTTSLSRPFTRIISRHGGCRARAQR